MSRIYEDATLHYTKMFSENVNLLISDTFQHYPEPDRYQRSFGITEGRVDYFNNNFAIDGIFTVNAHYRFTAGYSIQYMKNQYKKNWQYYYNLINNNFIDRNIDHTLSQMARTQHEVHWDSSNYTFVFYDYSWIQQNLGGVSHIHTPGLGYRHSFTNQLYAECRVAPDFLVPYNDIRLTMNPVQYYLASINPLYIRVFAFLTLVNDVDDRTTASLSFTYRTSIMENINDMFTSWQISGDFTRQVFTRLMVQASIYYGQGFYVHRNTTNRLFGFAPSVAYVFTENFSIRVWYDLSVNYTHVDGYRVLGGYVYNRNGFEVADSGYVRNRISIGATAEL